eukprot:g901.t1
MAKYVQEFTGYKSGMLNLHRQYAKDMSYGNALLEPIHNVNDAKMSEENIDVNISIIHKDLGGGLSELAIIDSTLKGFSEESMINAHHAHEGNENSLHLMGHHGVGLLAFLAKFLDMENLDRAKENEWILLSSAKSDGTFVAGHCNCEDLLINGTNPTVDKISISETEDDRKNEWRALYMQYQSDHIGDRQVDAQNEEEFITLLRETHGSVLIVRTTQQFGDLKKFWNSEIIPPFTKSIKLSGDSFIKVVINGEELDVAHSPFCNPAENMKATLRHSGQGVWNITGLEHNGITPLEEVVQESLKKDIASKFSQEMFIDESVPDGAEVSLTTSFRVGNMQRAKLLVAEPYTGHPYESIGSLMHAEGLMIGIKNGTMTTVLGRVTPCENAVKDCAYYDRKNYMHNLNHHPSSQRTDEQGFPMRSAEQLHLSFFESSVWLKTAMKVRIVKQESKLLDKGKGLQLKKAVFGIKKLMINLEKIAAGESRRKKTRLNKTQMMKDLKVEVSELQKSNKNILAHSTKVQTQYTKLKDQHAKLKDQHTELKAQFRAQSKNFKAQIGELKAENKKLKTAATKRKK